MVCLLEAEPSQSHCLQVASNVSLCQLLLLLLFFFLQSFCFLFVWGHLGAGVNFEYTRKGWIGNLCVQGVAFQSETCLVRNKAN